MKTLVVLSFAAIVTSSSIAKANVLNAIPGEEYAIPERTIACQYRSDAHDIDMGFEFQGHDPDMQDRVNYKIKIGLCYWLEAGTQVTIISPKTLEIRVRGERLYGVYSGAFWHGAE